MDTVRLFIGFDPREAAAYHVFCQSVIERSSLPVAFHPIHRGMLENFEGQKDGTNAFTVSRYLVPFMCDFNGWALFADGDMVCDRDIAELWKLKDEHIYDRAICVVRHDYKTRHKRKYVGSIMESANVDYPRKNWSSVMLWNCGHYANRQLTPDFVCDATPQYLHRFQWLNDAQIGDLPQWWNYLVGEDGPCQASLYHHTLGVPGIKHYADTYSSWKWHKELLGALACAGEEPVAMVERAVERIGAI